MLYQKTTKFFGSKSPHIVGRRRIIVALLSINQMLSTVQQQYENFANELLTHHCKKVQWVLRKRSAHLYSQKFSNSYYGKCLNFSKTKIPEISADVFFVATNKEIKSSHFNCFSYFFYYLTGFMLHCKIVYFCRFSKFVLDFLLFLK